MLVDNLDKPHKAFSIITEDEYKEILKLNKTDKKYPSHKTVYQLFEEQVDNYPNNVAVVYEGNELTYAGLNSRSNQLARYLQSKGVERESLVVLCLDRSLEMIIAILGVMKAGGAYVPVDPDYPSERIKHILEDTDSKLVLTQSHLVDKLKEFRKIDLVDLNSSCYDSECVENLSVQNNSMDLAYVIYTSGTAGKPKGVMIPHKNVHRLFSSTDCKFKFNDTDVWVLYHSYVFDFSVWEIWGALHYGGKLLIPNKMLVKNIPSFVRLCVENRVSILNQTPLALYSFIDNLVLSDIQELHIRYIILGGDALNINQLGSWWKLKKQYNYVAKLINMYGITETTVHVTYTKSLTDMSVFSNIGKHLTDFKIYILNYDFQLVPVGVVGELYIAGAGLARGYLNRPDLTAERFIPNPFVTKDDLAKGYTRLYKTGDLVRLLPDGDLEYIGRNDFQVKIRGYRIELGEIESALASIVGVKQACVLAKERNGNKYLIAYYISDDELEATESQILIELERLLPNHMVPSSIVKMDQFPLTINGKLDRSVLPEPNFIKEDTYVAPTTELEITLCNIWQEVLSLEKVGVHDDFFKIGGHSILAINVISKAKFKGIIIDLNSMFLYPCVSKLVKYVRYDEGTSNNKITGKDVSKLSALSPQSNELRLQRSKAKTRSLIDSIDPDGYGLSSYKIVLITGATGHLGAHILYELMESEDIDKVIILSRRRADHSSLVRITNKLKYYFKIIDEKKLVKIEVYECNLEDKNLGLDVNVYRSLLKKVNCIIHVAGNVKHFGHYKDSYSSNVITTENLLRMCRRNTSISFYYISTRSICEYPVASEEEVEYYVEGDIPEISHLGNSVYLKTKLLGELAVLKARDHGVKTTIFRVGNLICNSLNHKHQENIADNAFYHIVNGFVTSKKIIKILFLKCLL